ncbi:MAG TPA: MDR family MFS transporter [Aliidongia sp.]|uniref:MDR family MFS transporter n=1 Tax=Aliidongia sp. TaxID=1914230 RepID=UPI002DDD9C0C|nr:MDR family MFS transporter [Aliidongia sp.]HEV2676227.1 MDR family MFS transporter [Aliidongia sp.]
MTAVPSKTAPNAGVPANIRTVLTGLMLVLTLGALDQNIVATALPRIVGDLGDASRLSWIITAYVLASTITMPLYGKLSDQYGRKPLLYAAIAIFLGGSMLAALAQTMTQLILFRAVQGLGAGGLLPLAQITIGDLVSPRERGRYQGLFGAVFAGCSVGGPVLGGAITDALSWHWIFYVNLPVGAAAIGFIAIGLGRPVARVQHRIDYAGAALIALGTSGLLLALSLGGTTYGWTSPEIIGAALVALLSIPLFLFQERRSAEPVLPLHLFGNRTVAVSWGVLTLTFTGMSAATVFFPLFFQLVLGVAPTHSGLLTGPLMLGVITASVGGGRIVSRTGKYKRLPVIGLAAATLAFLGLGWGAMAGQGIALIEPLLIVLGLGLGFVMPTMTVALQNAVQPRDMGSATGTSAFFRSLGAVIGVALSGGILGVRLKALLAASDLAGQLDPASLLSAGVQQIGQMPAATREAVTGFYRTAIASTFLFGGIIAALAFLLVLFLPELPLRTTIVRAEPQAD